MSKPPSTPSEPEDGGAASEGASRKPFLLRLSPEVLDTLRGWASQEMRSLNGHIEYLLRRAIEERRKGARRKGD